MILSTLLATSLAAQPAPAPVPGAQETPAAQKKACCENMATGKGCCCCKSKEAKSSDKEHAGHDTGETGAHAH